MLTIRYAAAFPSMRINSVDPGFTATDASPVSRDAVGTDGLISDEATRGKLDDALATILAEVPPVAPA
jgi:hypothetical protein